MIIEISDLDITEVEHELGLSFDDTRKLIIKSFGDVQACPGSGKTTMVAAKLLIIAKKWKHTHQGVCVLTHTNVAKGEVIERLRGSTYGERLLYHPHFIGTIQEFVNRFFAIPYLRSNNLNINQIDDNICNLKGWSRLKINTRTYLERKKITSIKDLQCKFIDDELKITVPGFKNESTSRSYKDLISVKIDLMNNGYFFYHETYEFAKHYITRNLLIKDAIHSRFPIVFIDEMQDTQKFQDDFLNSVFQHKKVFLQRFGDPDQAIYGNNEEENETYNKATLNKVENSHRFNNPIASLAKNLSYNRINLRSDTVNLQQTLHTIFLVDEFSRNDIFAPFAKLCSLAVPENCELPIKTVGAVGQKKEDVLTICSYAENFNKDHSITEFKSTKLIHYFYESRHLTTYHEAYRLILNGIVRCARIANMQLSSVDDTQVEYSITNIRKYLKSSGTNIKFNILIMKLINNSFSEKQWVSAVTTLVGYIKLNISDKVKEFICFDTELIKGSSEKVESNKIFIDIEGRIIENQITTIHAVKGETHAATLVLETKFHSNDIATLIDYILVQNTAKPKATRKIKFMKQLYVALTRPKFLLCLAMDKSAFPIEHIHKSEYAGWRICDLTSNKI